VPYTPSLGKSIARAEWGSSDVSVFPSWKKVRIEYKALTPPSRITWGGKSKEAVTRRELKEEQEKKKQSLLPSGGSGRHTIPFRNEAPTLRKKYISLEKEKVGRGASNDLLKPLLSEEMQMKGRYEKD